MQADAAVGVAARRPVFQVPLNGASHGRQLAAYLMMTPREQLDLKQIITVALRNKPVGQFGQLAARHLLPVGVALVLPLVARKPVLQPSFQSRRRLTHNGPISLFNLMSLAEQGIHALQGFAGTGKNHASAHRAVEPVRNAQKHGARLGVTFLDVILYVFR
ncbi:unknown [Prevotella sp. CAG:617]|nr:unknown [Prevotella sp. CAG:617]